VSTYPVLGLALTLLVFRLPCYDPGLSPVDLPMHTTAQMGCLESGESPTGNSLLLTGQ